MQLNMQKEVKRQRKESYKPLKRENSEVNDIVEGKTWEKIEKGRNGRMGEKWRQEELGKVKVEINEKVEREVKNSRKNMKREKKNHNFGLNLANSYPFRPYITLKDLTE